MSDGDAGGGGGAAAPASSGAPAETVGGGAVGGGGSPETGSGSGPDNNAQPLTSNDDSGGANNSNNDASAAAVSSAAANNDPGEMAAPYGVAMANHNHDNDHDPALDRPPDLAYNQGRIGKTSPFQPRVHEYRPTIRPRTIELDEYFTGPRDIQKHSKWPMFLQMHGSILPKMLLPILAVGTWSMIVTSVSYFTKRNLGISSILLTVTGFVVGLGLSFRSSTAYERYAEGRRYWAQLMLATQALGRVFWVHAVEREGQKEKDMLTKLTSLNLLVGFAVALKHKLRHEPYTGYEDLVHLVGHLDTFAFHATVKEPERVHQPKPGFFKLIGGYLGISFAASNPRKTIKRANYPLGNLPLEILTYLACFTDEMVTNSQLVIPMHQTLAYNNIAVLNDVMVGADRVLNTPLPIAYSIAISQITWVYVFLLPFQLYPTLGWVTIPATIAASYIILGILFIGREIENPFGHDVNDLPLESYCAQIAMDLDILASKKKHRNRDWVESLDNKVLYPVSMSSWHVWKARGEHKVRDALRSRSEIDIESRKAMMSQKKHDTGSSKKKPKRANTQSSSSGGSGRSGFRFGFGRRSGGIDRNMMAANAAKHTTPMDEEANIGFNFFGSPSLGSSGSDLPGRLNSTGTFNKEHL
ncbi:hypothetical protein SEUCBS140593_007375 [Sporothrix eucalyptigena]|uniref:Uncharacterized protein n=1 Tax=Sporothrix eucalyptigena TaxID=1812306 RepID=A0ABP0CFG1_9PEZI